MEQKKRTNANHRRDLRLKAEQQLDEIVAALAIELATLLKDQTKALAEKTKEGPALLQMLRDARDLIEATSWSKDLKASILMNPRILDMAPGGAATHKIAAAAARVLKALKEDKRTQAERRVRDKADRQWELDHPGSPPPAFGRRAANRASQPGDPPPQEAQA